MRTRDKQRIWRRFAAGESCESLVTGGWVVSWSQLESILREGLAGKLDAKSKIGENNQSKVLTRKTE